MHLRLLLSAVLLSACASRGPASRPEPLTASAAFSGDYGTAHPFALQASAEDGRWLVACQAREDTSGDGRIEVRFGYHGDLHGDALRPYLFLEPGPGIPIDDVLAEDPTGRFLALVRDNTLRLFDTHTREEVVLVSGVTPDATSPQPPVRATFSQDGLRLLYLRPEGSKHVAVVRDVARGTEHVLDSGGGILGQALLDPAGRWAAFDVVAEDTDGDGKLTWPQQKTTLASALCRGPVMVSSHYGWKGDRPVRRFRRVAGGPLLEGDDLIQPLGEGMLRRAPDGAIVFEHAEGRRETWVPASCAAEVLHTDAARQQLLVVCDAKQPLGSLELHGAGIHQPLGWKVPLPGRHDLRSGRDKRLVSLKAHSEAQPEAVPIVIDLERRTVQPMPATSGEMVMALGTQVLMKEFHRPPGSDSAVTRKLWLWNAETGEKIFVSESNEYEQQRAGDLVLSMGWLVDLSTRRALGAVEDSPLAIDSQGRALRTSTTSANGSPLAREGAALLGPVRWEPAVKAPSPASVPAPATPRP